ncbi:MAG: TVP38/TMEM64 family protein [Desulfobulbaceae bacterium]|uniref:TVP38/TMEM64 family membrane protein n=1 Tax=Candidatus Desulfatifera sulfidica TaxID=2841691 RepID=A0A8J6NCH8_9BACT|nr:TVP38/TMEM64 family protein [Candidatus Desulfatifera sulfidica]
MKKLSNKKLGIILILIAASLLIKILDLDQLLTLEQLKDSRTRLAQFYADSPLIMIGAYMGIYIVATAISLPGAVILTLTGGALFGLALGTLLISFASTIGATLACAVSRFLLRDWVQQKFGDRLTAINRGMEEEGGFYLFSLRLVPIFPFFIINLAMGLSQIRLTTYYWVSQLGMLPATLVYVNAGSELGRLDSLAGILSPSLILSFVILGLFPITVKKTLAYIRQRRNIL